MQGTVEGGCKRERQQKSWSDNVKELRSLFVSSALRSPRRLRMMKLASKLINLLPEFSSKTRFKINQFWMKLNKFNFDLILKTKYLLQNSENVNRELRVNITNLLKQSI